MRFVLPVSIAALVAVYVWTEHAKAPTCEVWAYRTRKGEEASRAYVCAVEEDERYGTIYHVYVDGLDLANPEATGEDDARITVLTHLPITEEAFLQSVTKRVEKRAPMPPYRAGYETWKKEFDEGRARVFAFPLHMCIEQVARMSK